MKINVMFWGTSRLYYRTLAAHWQSGLESAVVQGSGYSYRPPHGGGGRVGKRDRSPRGCSCGILFTIGLALLVMFYLFFADPPLLSDFQRWTAQWLSGIPGNEARNYSDLVQADYHSDPNNAGLLAGEAVVFRELDSLDPPQAFGERLSLLSDGREQYLFCTLHRGGFEHGVVFLGPGGRTIPGYNPPALNHMDSFINWDMDRDGTDELIPVIPAALLESDGLQLDNGLLEGMQPNLASLVMDADGNQLKALHGLRPFWRLKTNPVADIDGDGWDELVLTDELVGDGKTKFIVYGRDGRKLASLLVSRTCYFAGTSDTNGDGGREMVMFDYVENKAFVMSLRGDQRLLEINTTLSEITACLDVDGDGVNELLDATQGFWNPVSGSFTAFDHAPGAGIPEEFLPGRHMLAFVADLDADTTAQLIVLHHNGREVDRLYIFNAAGKPLSSLELDSGIVDARVLQWDGQDRLVLLGHTGAWLCP